MKLSAVILMSWIVLGLAGCSGTQEAIQTSVDRTVMGTLVGRSYASATATMPDLPLTPVREPPYGRLFSTTTLPDGTRVHRHLIRQVGQTSRINFMGIAQSETQRFSYRLLYFRVDQAGTIVETANGFWLGESQRCVGYIGNIFQNCENPQALAADVAFFDSLVKLADGRPVTEAWFRAR